MTGWQGRPAVFAASVPTDPEAFFYLRYGQEVPRRTCAYHSHDFVPFIVFPHQGLHFGRLRKGLSALEPTRNDQGIVFILQIVDKTARR